VTALLGLMRGLPSCLSREATSLPLQTHSLNNRSLIELDHLLFCLTLTSEVQYRGQVKELCCFGCLPGLVGEVMTWGQGRRLMLWELMLGVGLA